MADILFVNGLQVEVTLGVPEWERAIKQKINIDLELATDIRPAAKSDRIEDTFNYQVICARLVEFVEASQFTLVETLAEQCAQLILSEFQVPWVRLRIAKAHLVRQSKEAGVLIERGIKPS